MGPEEVEESIDAHWWNREFEDQQQAYYTRSLMMSMGAKKKDAEKVRFMPPRDEQQQVEGQRSKKKVVSIEEHKRAKSAIARSRQQIPWEGSG